MPNIVNDSLVSREKIIFPALSINCLLDEVVYQGSEYPRWILLRIFYYLWFSFRWCFFLWYLVFDRPRIRALVLDQEFARKMNDKISFVAVMVNFLGNKKSEKSAFLNLGCNKSVKDYYMYTHLKPSVTAIVPSICLLGPQNHGGRLFPREMRQTYGDIRRGWSIIREYSESSTEFMNARGTGRFFFLFSFSNLAFPSHKNFLSTN